MHAIHRPVALADGGRSSRLCLDRDFLRVAQVTPRYTLNFPGHGRRKQRHLALFRDLLQDPFDIVDKAHAQHLIGLIQHQGLQVIEFEGTFAHMVHDPARRTHNSVNAPLQLPDLS